jgi:hypothetical protein
MGGEIISPGDLYGRVLQVNEVHLCWDGNLICALVGPDLVIGVSGFGAAVPDALRELADNLVREAVWIEIADDAELGFGGSTHRILYSNERRWALPERDPNLCLRRARGVGFQRRGVRRFRSRGAPATSESPGRAGRLDRGDRCKRMASRAAGSGRRRANRSATFGMGISLLSWLFKRGHPRKRGPDHL